MGTKSRVTPLWLWHVLAASAMLAITLTGVATRAEPIVTVGLFGALIAALFLLGLRSWRGIDEVAREAQKSACMWGARIGAGINAILLMALVVMGGDAWLPAHFTPSTYVVFGVAASTLPMIIAYQICWGMWWFRRR